MITKDVVIGYNSVTNQKIATTIFQRITHPELCKIEVRHPASTQQVSHRGIQTTLAALAKRQALPRIDFSCRPHDNPLDNATGETLIRFHYRQDGGHETTARLGLLQKLFGKKPVSPKLALDSRPVIDELKAALKTASVAYAHKFARPPVQEVMHVSIIAREDRFQALLNGMSSQALASWCHGQLQQHKTNVSDSLTATYSFIPFRSHEGTDLLGGGDIEVELYDTPQSNIPGPRPIHESDNISVQPLRHTNNLNNSATQDLGTLPPDMLPAERSFSLELRIESLDGIGKEGILNITELPAHIDRNTLIRAGLSSFAPEVINVASQSMPLTVDITPAGRLYLESHLHTHMGRPMYFLDTGAEPKPIIKGISLPNSTARVFVNAPQGVRHPTRGHLPPIMLQLTVLATHRQKEDQA